jgi:hypothetical protein
VFIVPRLIRCQGNRVNSVRGRKKPLKGKKPPPKTPRLTS